MGRHLGFVSVSYELTKPTEDKSGDDFKDAHTHTPAHNGCLIMIPITSWALTSSAWVCLIYYLHSFQSFQSFKTLDNWGSEKISKLSNYLNNGELK